MGCAKMGNLYEIIVGLCNERGVTQYRMCKDAGVARSTMTELKSGRTQSLSAETLQKIAGYFRVPVDYFFDLGEPNPRDIPQEPELSDDQLIVAFWGKNPKNMNKDDLERLRSFARYMEQEKGDEN